MTKPLRTIRALLLCALVALPLMGAATASASATSFWTEERMKEAIPADVLVERPDETGVGGSDQAGPPAYVAPSRPGARSARLRRGSAPASPAPETFLAGVVRELVPDPTVSGVRAHGKVFFTVERQGEKPKMYVCSGTVVSSKVRSVVLTAGHCVFDAQGTRKFMDNWVFVPAYGKDSQPFGVWPAKGLATTKEWRRQGNIRYDVGTAILARQKGVAIQDVVGARGIAFNQKRNRLYNAYGYPHTDPEGGEFDGSKQYVCQSEMTRRDAPLGGPGPLTTQIRCDMSSGASGGSWIVGRIVHSLTSYSYDLDVIHLYGPYFGKTARTLYAAVRNGLNKKSKKKVAAKTLSKRG